MEASNGYSYFNCKIVVSLAGWFFKLQKPFQILLKVFLQFVFAVICDGEPSNKWTLPW